MISPVVAEAAADFARTLAKWRDRRHLSKAQLAAAILFDPSYVSRMESPGARPTENFARKAEAVLRTRGELWERFLAYEEARRQSSNRRAGAPSADAPETASVTPYGSVVVERETAALRYQDGIYHCSIERRLLNRGSEPVTRYPVVISVDKYPGDAVRSNEFYREHPLSIGDLNFTAYLEVPPAGTEQIDWEPDVDKDSYKEILLSFKNDRVRMPLLAGEYVTVRYHYSVPEDHWGSFFEREIRMPTEGLEIRLEFPESAGAIVWGIHRTLTVDAPLRTNVNRTVENGMAVFTWSTSSPPLLSWYRMEWSFAPPAG